MRFGLACWNDSAPVSAASAKPPLRIRRRAEIVRHHPQLVVAARFIAEAVEQEGETIHRAYMAEGRARNEGGTVSRRIRSVSPPERRCWHRWAPAGCGRQDSALAECRRDRRSVCRASAANALAIGAGSTANRAGLAGAAEAFSGTDVAPTQGALSIGAAGAERQITNVAGGTQASDAVNASQLSAVGSNLANSLGGGAAFDPTTGAYTARSPRPHRCRSVHRPCRLERTSLSCSMCKTRERKHVFGTTTPARTGDLLIHNQAL